MQRKTNSIVSFSDVKIGEMFRILRPDVIGERQVLNAGLYVKVSTTIAVDIAHNNKDIIPTFKVPCRVVTSSVNVDVTQLETYKACNKGRP